MSRLDGEIPLTSLSQIGNLGAAVILPQPGLGGGLCLPYCGQVGQCGAGLAMDASLLTQGYRPIRLGFSHYGLVCVCVVVVGEMDKAMTTPVYFQAMSLGIGHEMAGRQE